MPRVIINNEQYQAAEGELLLDVARRNGAHIGFVCNANGICSTCEFKVLTGAETLSPVSNVETDWLPRSRLGRGHRLGCQAAVNTVPGATELRVITRVEEFKRQYLSIFSPSQGEDFASNTVKFMGNLSTLTLEHMAQSPVGLVNTVNRLGIARFLFPWNDVDGWLRDAGRVIDHELPLNGEVKMATADFIPPATPDEAGVKVQVHEVNPGDTKVEVEIGQKEQL